MTMRVALTLLAGLVATTVFSEEGQLPAKPAAAAQAASLADDEKLSYALGMDLANTFKRQATPLNPDVFARGMKDALSGGSTLLTEQETRTLIAAWQMEIRKKREGDRRAAAEKAQADGDAFLAANKAKAGVVTLESGLQYEILKEGAGSKPTLEDTVDCQYRGTLVDGTEFDSSYARNQPATFAVKGVVKGWTEALQLMPVGSKWRIVVPPQLAYGERGTGPIAPNSTLVFELELLGVK
jgi:FKBP-type peptidyl-prolyl cis-trans isomerase FkpA